MRLCDDLFAKADVLATLLGGCKLPPKFSVAVDEPILSDGTAGMPGDIAYLIAGFGTRAEFKPVAKAPA